MGKAARRMKKKQEQAAAAETRQENSALEKKLAEQMAAGEYAAAIDTLADLVKGEDMKPQFMYNAAYAYFMLNDYERAGEWINNTLTYAPEHIPVRILLARLLILDGREDDGLAIFDFVLRDDAAALTEEQKDEVEEIVEFYGRTMGEKVRRDYPNIAAFLMLEDGESDMKKDESILDSLRRKVVQASAVVEERAAEAVGEMSERAVEAAAVASERAAEAVAAASERAAEAMAAVKPMVEAQAAAVQDAVTAAMPKVEAGAAAMAKKPAELLAKLKQRIAAANAAAEREGADDVTPAAPSPQEARAAVSDPQRLAAAELVKQNILAKGLPAADKVELLTSFAGGYYYQGDLMAAELLLAAVLELLPPSDESLTNMALVQVELGKREEAFQTASRMKLASFLLLRLLRG